MSSFLLPRSSHPLQYRTAPFYACAPFPASLRNQSFSLIPARPRFALRRTTLIQQAQIDLTLQRGQVSQSFQVAPFDNGYWPVDNSSKAWISYDAEDVVVNSYRGGVYQQALSHLAYVNDDVFVKGGGDFGVYGMSPESHRPEGLSVST
jgi:hypothetical protein